MSHRRKTELELLMYWLRHRNRRPRIQRPRLPFLKLRRRLNQSSRRFQIGSSSRSTKAFSRLFVSRKVGACLKTITGRTGTSTPLNWPYKPAARHSLASPSSWKERLELPQIYIYTGENDRNDRHLRRDRLLCLPRDDRVSQFEWALRKGMLRKQRCLSIKNPLINEGFI